MFAFDAPDWEPPKAVVLDTNVVAEALLPNEQEHQPCVALLERLADTGTAVVFSRLLEIERWEAVFNLALRERHPRKNLRYVRYDNPSATASRAAVAASPGRLGKDAGVTRLVDD